MRPLPSLLVALVLTAGLGASSAQEPCLVLEDFARAPIGAFPPDWHAREAEARAVYDVQEEAGRRFLRAVARDQGIQAGRATERWDLRTHPVLAWSWRPQHFPAGADERDPAKNDSALAVYMLVEHSRIRGPKAVKYVWSERVPAGSRLTSNNGLTQVRVLRTGRAPAPGWVEERVDVLGDFKGYFAEADTPTPSGIAVLTDSDDTDSVAAGDYANFRACPR